MARYAILDLEKFTEIRKEYFEKGYDMYKEPFYYIETEAILSPEETEAKWKEVWNAADERCCDEWDITEYGSGNRSKKPDWEQFKQSL